MYKYFAIFCTLLVLTACSGMSGSDADFVNPRDELSNSDDALNWDLLGGGDEDDADTGGDDDTYLGGSGGSDVITTARLKLNSCYPSIPRNLGGAKDVNCELSAEGGSGTYEWSAQDLPDWLRFEEIANDKVVVTGKAPSLVCEDEPYNFKIKVYDAENDSSYKSKTFRGKVIAPCLRIDPMIGRVMEIPETLRIETSLTSDSTGIYAADLDEIVDMKFKAIGGVAPYTWRFEGITIPSEIPTDGPPPPAVIDEDGHVVDIDGNDVSVTFESGKDEYINISGMFEGDQADKYCQKRDTSLIPIDDGETIDLMDDSIIICSDLADGAHKVYRKVLKVTVSDSAGNTISSEYEFNLNPPSRTNETFLKVMYIEAQMRAHDCGGDGCKGYIYLFGKDSMGVEHEIGHTRGIQIVSSDWNQKTVTVPFNITDVEHADIKLEKITKVRVYIRDYGICDYGEMWLDWFIVYSEYHYLFADLQGHPIGGEVGLGYSTYASKLLSDLPSDPVWQTY